MNEDTNHGGRGWEVAAWMTILALLLAFLLPWGRLGEVWGTGSSSANSAMTAVFCRNYDALPLRLENLLPCRTIKDGAGDGYYVSQFAWPYLLYSGLAQITGTSETAMRGIATGFAVGGGLLLLFLLRLRLRDRRAMFAAAVLYAGSPLTLRFGDMAEPFLLMGITLAPALFFYSEYLKGRSSLRVALLAFLPFSLSSSFLPPFVIACLFVIHLCLCGFGNACRTAFVLSLPWAVCFALHLLMVNASCGDLHPFFGRGTTRSAWSALQHGNPLPGLWKAWGERLGLPILILSGVALFRVLRSLHTTCRDHAGLLITLGSAFLFTFAMLELVSVHDYALYLFLPSFALFLAPSLGEMLAMKNRWRIFGILLLITCVCFFAHRLRRRSTPDAFEMTLAAAAREAGAHCEPNGKILLLTDKAIMGSHMSVIYYSGRTIDRVIYTPDAEVDYRNCQAILGTNVNAALPDILRDSGIPQEAFTLRNNVLLFLRPKGVDSVVPPGADTSGEGQPSIR